MGKVYIGVIAVGGHKLWGGGGVEGAVCFPHSAHMNVENTCNFYLIIIV